MKKKSFKCKNGRKLKQLTKEEVYTVDTISFSDLFYYKLTWDVASSFPFSLEGTRKRFLYDNQSFFVISPIKSIPFHKFSRDHLRSTLGITCGRGSFAVSGSFAVLYITSADLTTLSDLEKTVTILPRGQHPLGVP